MRFDLQQKHFFVELIKQKRHAKHFKQPIKLPQEQNRETKLTKLSFPFYNFSKTIYAINNISGITREIKLKP